MNYREIIRSLFNENDQSRVRNVQQIRISLKKKKNRWVLNILQDLVTAVQDDDSRLRSLDIAGSEAFSVNWTSLPVDLLAQVLVSLECSFDLNRTGPKYELRVRPFQFKKWNIENFSPDHVSSLFKMIVESSVMNMKELFLNSDIPHIPAEFLSQAVTKLEIFRTVGDFLTAAQISAVFTRLSVVEENKLKTLYLYGINLRSVPSDFLVAGISEVEKVTLRDNRLTTEQITGIFTGLLVLEDHKLRKLELNCCDLSLVPTDNLVAGISGLEEVYLIMTQLTTEQLTGIYRMVADRRCSRLRLIYLYGNVLNSVSRDLHERAKLNQTVRMIIV